MFGGSFTKLPPVPAFCFAIPSTKHPAPLPAAPPSTGLARLGAAVHTQDCKEHSAHGGNCGRHKRLRGLRARREAPRTWDLQAPPTILRSAQGHPPPPPLQFPASCSAPIFYPVSTQPSPRIGRPGAPCCRGSVTSPPRLPRTRWTQWTHGGHRGLGGHR